MSSGVVGAGAGRDAADGEARDDAEAVEDEGEVEEDDIVAVKGEGVGRAPAEVVCSSTFSAKPQASTSYASVICRIPILLTMQDPEKATRIVCLSSSFWT